MDIESQKSDEREVLSSIYNGDDNFTAVDENTFQYRIEPNGDSRHAKRFMLQLHWPENYPEAIPEVNLDIFYNGHLHHSDKDEIKRRILEEASNWVGCATTFTLFEFAKENWDSFISESSLAETSSRGEEKTSTSVVERREAQVDAECRPRGWNWVDIVKHLCQVGPAQVDAKS